ncbi:MAG: hypothetical protein ACLTDF_02715 [Coprococcus sp.]
MAADMFFDTEFLMVTENQRDILTIDVNTLLMTQAFQMEAAPQEG